MNKYLRKFQHPFKDLSSIRELCICGLLLALCVVLSKFGTIYLTNTIKISFSFIAVVAVACLYGPLVGGFVGAMADVLSWAFSMIGPYFPGFTISAFIAGCVYGIFLYQEEPKIWRGIASCGINMVVISVILNTWWLKILYGYGFVGLLPIRLLKSAFSLPVEILVTVSICKLIPKILRRVR